MPQVSLLILAVCLLLLRGELAGKEGVCAWNRARKGVPQDSRSRAAHASALAPCFHLSSSEPPSGSAFTKLLLLYPHSYHVCLYKSCNSKPLRETEITKFPYVRTLAERSSGRASGREK